MKTHFLFLVATALSVLPSHARYARVETEDLPLERILTNLTEKVKENPDDANAIHQLARTHAVAYANKLGDADPVKSWTGWGAKKGPAMPWFGYQPAHVPFNSVAKTDDDAKAEAAKAHLDTAIDIYKKALAAKPDDLTIRLGLAWCQDQAGAKEEAVANYRAVAAAAWEIESKRRGGLGNFVYVETSGYLIPLLDPDKDAEEIAKLEAGKKTLLALPRAVTPLVIPVGKSDELNALVDHGARVRFDLDGTGRILDWPWITKDAAWLVYDPKATGKITSSIQMFGSRSFLLFCADGYGALSLLDDDRNGSISGEELSGLALWNDLDQDGVSDAGEVKPVADHGIRSLSARGKMHASGIPYSPAGVTFDDGSTRPTYDLIFESK